MKTICWRCQNSTGYCNWSRSLEPVDGWEIMPGEVSVIVVNCPEFIKDERGKVSMGRLAELLGKSKRTLYRYDRKYIQHLIRNKRLPIVWDERTNRWVEKN